MADAVSTRWAICPRGADELLRVLQERRYRPLSAAGEYACDVYRGRHEYRASHAEGHPGGFVPPPERANRVTVLGSVRTYLMLRRVFLTQFCERTTDE